MVIPKHPLWWLSYADEKTDQSLGVVIVRAPSFPRAAVRANELGVSPGGQLKGFEAPLDYESVLEPFMDRLLTPVEARELAEKPPISWTDRSARARS